MNWGDRQIEKLLFGIYNGTFSGARLPKGLYLDTFNELFGAVTDVFGGDVGSFPDGSPDLDLLEHFKYNVAIFSGAKTHQNVVDMSAEIFVDGKKQSFSDFKQSAAQIFKTYNESWLKTEFNMANNQAIQGRKWLEIQANKDIFPNLKYVTIGDERVREDHAILDGTVRPVDDPFWRRFYPPNDWGCRCKVEQMLATEHPVTDQTDIEKIVKQYTPGELFDGNVGIDKMIFDLKHPYFLVKDRFTLLKQNNFNLPTPPKPKKRAPVIKVKKAPTVVSIDPEHTIQLKKSIKEITGMDPEKITNQRIWKHLPESLTITGETKGGAFYRNAEKRVNISVKEKRYRESAYGLQHVILHELGHSVHYQLRQIDMINVSDLAQKFKTDLKKSFEKKWPVVRYGTAPYELSKRASFWVNSYGAEMDFVKTSAKLLREKGVENSAIIEMISDMFDVVGGLTNGNLGGGHDKTYYKRNNGGIKEVFANTFSMINSTDPNARLLWKEFWPEAIEICEKYFDEILK